MVATRIDDILPWHRGQWSQMLQSRSLGRRPHALLCVGPAGVGKRHFAELMAKTHFCQAIRVDGLPCNGCHSCQLLTAGSHPDYLRVEPEESDKPIRVDQIREVGEFLGLTDGFGRGKVVLVVAAERMTANAANSLLKTLEEPPGASFLYLETAFPSRLPATVRSRCQRLMFQIPPFAQAAAWLSERVGEADTNLLLHFAEGAPLAALACLEHGKIAQRLERFENFIAVVNGNADPVRVADLWVKDDFETNLRWVIGWHMDMIRLKMAEQSTRLLNPDLRDTLLRLSSSISRETLFRLLDSAVHLRDLSRTQANRQLMIEVFLCECAVRYGNDRLARRS